MTGATALPHSHFTPGARGLMFNVEACEQCGADCQAPNALRKGGNTPAKLRRLGLVQLAALLPELGHCEALGVAVCPSCYVAEADDDDGARFDGSTAVAALEQVWRVIQSHNADAPRVVFLLGGGSDVRGQKTWGHWWAGRWRVEDGERIGEVMISGERLGMGAEWVLSTLLHECAHALAFVREIKDTSRNGIYHNKRFAALAVECGLTVEKQGKRGLAKTGLTDATRELYAAELEGLAVVCARGHRLDRKYAPRVVKPKTPTEGGGEGGEEAAPTNGKRITLACQCGRKIRIVHSVAAVGFVACGECFANAIAAGAGAELDLSDRQIDALAELMAAASFAEVSR